jgi:hypothetical protein
MATFFRSEGSAVIRTFRPTLSRLISRTTAMARLHLAFSLMMVGLTQQPHPAGPTSLATAVWGQLQAVPWDTAYGDWHRAHPTVGCQEHSSDPAAAFKPDELWSYRCEQGVGQLEADWVFYAFDVRDPVIPQLSRFDATATGPPLADLEAARDSLSGQISARYGLAENPAVVSAFGSAFWRHVQRWRTSKLEILLYVDLFRRDQPRLGLQARRRSLLDALAMQDRVVDVTQSRDASVNAQLADGIRAAFPAAALLLGSLLQVSPDQRALRAAVLQLLDATSAGSPQRRAMLLVAADRLADLVTEAARQSPQWDEQRQRFADRGLHFEWAELDGGWIYPHDLLLRVWSDYGTTPWGEQAFLDLLSRGWTTHVACQDGSDQFRLVIEHGQSFLRAHPNTPLRSQILLFVAQAYETWWSLSLASANDDYADRRQYQDGASAARLKAVENYDELLRRGDAGDLQVYARLALPRLRLGVDTNQRRFFCVYD